MKFDFIEIDDFGVFKNQKLENLSSNVNIIGGYNRAGKTTFTKFIKALGYGVKKSDNVYCNISFKGEADVFHNDKMYKIYLDGYKDPKIITNDNISIRDIFDLDYYTFNHLFSIDLEELKLIEKDSDKIQGVLLGAGLKDLIKIPEYIKDFNKLKENIGGKNGSPNVREFKLHTEIIKEKLKSINENKKNLEDYINKKEDIQNLDKIIILKEESLKEKQDYGIVLELLLAFYHSYIKYRDINNFLKNKEKYLEKDFDLIILEKYNTDLESLSREEEKARLEFNELFDDICLLDKILEKKEEIENLYLNISIYLNDISELEKDINLYDKRKSQIENEIVFLNNKLQGSLEEIYNLDIDLIKIKNIKESIEKVQGLEGKISESQKNIDNINITKQLVEENYKNNKEKNIEKTIKKYIFLSFAILLIGSVVFIENNNLGTIISVFGIVSLGLIFFIKIREDSNNRKKSDKAKSDYDKTIKELELEKDNLSYYMDKKEAQFLQLQEIIREYKLPNDSSYYQVLTYFEKALDLKIKIKDLKQDEKSFITKDKRNKEFLNKCSLLVFNVFNIKVENYQEIFEKIKYLREGIEVCKKFKRQISAKQELEEEIKKYIEPFNVFELQELIDILKKQNIKIDITKSVDLALAREKIKKILKEENTSDFFLRYDEFISKDELEKNIKENESLISVIRSEIEDSKGSKNILAFEVDNLNSNFKIEDAKIKLEKQRKKLKD
ncbi:MAG: AAA family ATPase, partial [Clostridiaceae bacterium]